MKRKEGGLWWDALWVALSDLHRGPNKWRNWNSVEGFILPWLQELDECFHFQ
jgi:hypothetical protein